MTALPQDVVADLGQENARLQAELRTARERQTASAEILRAIAGTSGDAERSLRQIAEITARLFGASSVTLNIAGGDDWARHDPRRRQLATCRLGGFGGAAADGRA